MFNALLGIHAVEAAVMCHRSSNAMQYAFALTVVLWAIGSAFAWRRFFSTQLAATQVSQPI
jgi:hypothetical protein